MYLDEVMFYMGYVSVYSANCDDDQHGRFTGRLLALKIT